MNTTTLRHASEIARSCSATGLRGKVRFSPSRFFRLSRSRHMPDVYGREPRFECGWSDSGRGGRCGGARPCSRCTGGVNTTQSPRSFPTPFPPRKHLSIRHGESQQERAELHRAIPPIAWSRSGEAGQYENRCPGPCQAYRSRRASMMASALARVVASLSSSAFTAQS